ncbi:TspO/MBR family protein [Gallaecimonas mangrovi]|uniref:TspO/MBR family protein n=1 Tax=Gallaecimonas mangrovi TaxID=2291597 RepID=UPI000E20C725|nr:TspO/MBR family protein [Gallaecimonas mangrovi]
MTLMQKNLSFIVSLALVCLVGTLGALASVDAKAFYGALNQPSWAPPAWLFGPVWTLLYLMMAFSLWLYWLSAARKPLGLVIFLLQLAANALWSWLFFKWHLGAWALLDVLLLLVLIAASVRLFLPANRLAGYLLLPYLAWVGFASVLTLGVWQLNPAVLG